MQRRQLPELLKFEWDAGNSLTNQQKHDVSLVEAEQMFLGGLLRIADDTRHSGQEERFQALGETSGGRLLFAVFTMRRGRVRIISVRDMNRRERIRYEQIKKEARSALPE